MNVQQYKNIILPMLAESFEEREADNLFKYALEDYFKKRYLDIKDFDLSDDEIEELNFIYEKISNHYPIQYIFNKTEFYGMEFYVDENVLIPRSETEELTEWILSDYEHKSEDEITLLDIGTGSGCIPIVIKKNKPAWNIFAVDISEKALEVAKVNALKHHTLIEFFQMDILTNTHFSVDKDLYEETNDKIPFLSDIIVSNPPYIPEKEKALMSVSTLHHEPQLALFVNDEHPIIFYEKIADFALIHLKEKGKLYFELNEFNANEVYKMLIQKGFKDIIIRKDFAGKDRLLRASL